MTDIVLAGCTPTPLASYLKALGVLRILSEPFPDIRAMWRGEVFVVRSDEGCEHLEDFLLSAYQPTPVIAPWNGGSGFFDGDNKAAIDAIRSSQTSRLARYREAIGVADQTLAGTDRTASPKDSAKAALLVKLRGLLPDAALEWFDAAVMISGELPQYPPLLGTGGNDGRLDFTNNFMQRLCDVFDPENGTPTRGSLAWLRTALFGEAAPDLMRKAIGQFSPGQVGGPNATTGFEAESLMNPWDYVLMIEGALMFAAAAVRRHAEEPEGTLSYPFTVKAVGAGSGNVGAADAASARGELWMPLWQSPASYSEIRALFGEGRVALGRKPARDALDFVRAVHRLGGYRGLDSFQRYGLLMRSGKAFLATPLARIAITHEPKPQWLDELDRDDWLARFRRYAQGDTIPRRFLSLKRRLEDLLFDLAGRPPTAASVQQLLAVLADIQAALAVRKSARESVPPVPRLSEDWTRAADDGTAAFRITCALAGLTQDGALPLRAQLFPIHPRFHEWMEEARRRKGAADDPAMRLRICVPLRAKLPERMIDLLARRLWLAEQLGIEDKPLGGPAGVDFDDLLAFLQDDRLDEHIKSLIPGLSLCHIPQDTTGVQEAGALPAAVALLELVFAPDSVLRRLGLIGAKDRLPSPPGLLRQLAAGNAGNRAIRLAWQRLRACGLEPLFDAFGLPELGHLDPRRTAAALLIPLRYGAIDALAKTALKPPRPQST